MNNESRLPVTEQKPPVIVSLAVEGFGQTETHTHEFERAEWDAMTPAERTQAINEVASDFAGNHVGWGWHIEDPDDYAAATATPSADPTKPDRAATLASLYSLITVSGLPAPGGVQFRTDSDDDTHHLSLDFDTAEDAQAWARHFDSDDRYATDRVYQPEWRDGPIHSYTTTARPVLGFTSALFSGWTAVDAPADDVCGLTQSHTREVCGNPNCRES